MNNSKELIEFFVQKFGDNILNNVVIDDLKVSRGFYKGKLFEFEYKKGEYFRINMKPGDTGLLYELCTPLMFTSIDIPSIYYERPTNGNSDLVPTLEWSFTNKEEVIKNIVNDRYENGKYIIEFDQEGNPKRNNDDIGFSNIQLFSSKSVKDYKEDTPKLQSVKIEPVKEDLEIEKIVSEEQTPSEDSVKQVVSEISSLKVNQKINFSNIKLIKDFKNLVSKISNLSVDLIEEVLDEKVEPYILSRLKECNISCKFKLGRKISGYFYNLINIEEQEDQSEKSNSLRFKEPVVNESITFNSIRRSVIQLNVDEKKYHGKIIETRSKREQKQRECTHDLVGILKIGTTYNEHMICDCLACQSENINLEDGNYNRRAVDLTNYEKIGRNLLREDRKSIITHVGRLFETKVLLEYPTLSFKKKIELLKSFIKIDSTSWLTESEVNQKDNVKLVNLAKIIPFERKPDYTYQKKLNMK